MQQSLAPINPVDIYAYIDKIVIWLKQPLSKRDHARLSASCGKIHVDNVAKFDWQYGQRLQLYQPKRAALEQLAQRNDVHLSYVEVSLDWTFDVEVDKNAAFAFACRHVIKKYHRNQGIRFVDGTRYTGPRRSPNVLVTYATRHSKVTGELHCLHFDWRMNGNAALRRAGFSSVRDLINLDHREFWRQRLFFYAIDPEKLGRRLNNASKGTHRRRPWLHKLGRRTVVNVDLMTASIILRGLRTEAGYSVQAVLDAYTRFDLRSSLIPISVAQFLPNAGTHIYSYADKSQLGP